MTVNPVELSSVGDELSSVGKLPGRGVIDGAFLLLHALPQTMPGRQVAQLVRLTGIPRPTVHRLLGQLREAGAVDLVEDHWVLSAGLMRLARRVEPHAGLRGSAHDILRVVRAETGASVSLVVPESTSPVILEAVPGLETLPVPTRVGDQIPAFTAAGRVLASGRLPLPRDRNSGVSVDHSQLWEGFTCYAVPVPLPGGHRAALQLSAVGGQPAEWFAPHLHRAAVALQQRMVARS